MDNAALKFHRSKLVQAVNRAQSNIMIPKEVREMLLNASKLITELTDREIARDGKGK